MTTRNQETKLHHRPEIDISSVTSLPGEGYSNWKKIAKQKLKEREDKIMSVRVSITQSIINKRLKTFEKLNQNQIRVHKPFQIPTNIIDECCMKLGLCLELWNGVSLTKTKRSLSTFNQYFVASKNWFDVKKKKILGPVFWVVLFEYLQTYSVNTAHTFFKMYTIDGQTQELFAKQAIFEVISGIFLGELHYASKKSQPLISCAMLKDCDAMKQYLARLHNSLNIDTIYQTEEHANATEIYKIINKKLIHLAGETRKEFQKQFERVQPRTLRLPTLSNPNLNGVQMSHGQNVQKSSVNVQTIQNVMTQSVLMPVNIPMSVPMVTRPITPLIISGVNHGFVNGFNHGYVNVHSSPRNVYALRYNPMHGSNINYNYCNGNGNGNVANTSLLQMCLSLLSNNRVQ